MTNDAAPKRSPRPWAALLFPGAIALLALALRLWGITWALPNAGRWFSYHPDESVVVGASLRVNPLLLLLDPGFYNYGSLSLLLNGLFIHLGEWVGLVGSGPAPNAPSAGALLTARLVTAVLGTGTCLFLYGTGRLLYGRVAGFAAALLYAVAPLAVQHGHFATVDVPATFWVAGSLYFAARHTSPERRPRDLFWAGLWAGLAAAAKYNAGIVLLAAWAAWFVGRPRAGGRTLAVSIAGAAVGFLAGCPGIFLNTPRFLHDFLFEVGHSQQGSADLFTGTPSGLIYHLTFNLAWGMGWPLVIAAIAGVGYGLYRRRPGDLVLLAFALPYYLLIGLAQVKFARYTLPLFPPLLLLVGGWVPAAAKGRAVGRLALGALGAAAAVALVLSLAFDAVMTRPDSRDEAAAYLRDKAVPSVGFATGPWFWSPTLAPGLTNPTPLLAQQAALESVSPTLFPSAVLEEAVNANGQLIQRPRPVEWNVDLLRSTDPAAVALSEFEYADAQRINNPSARAYLTEVAARYPTRRIFAHTVQVFGLPVTKLNESRGLPTQHLPHDMLYTNPATVVYTR
jgi:4-amino-4-deoxy-L-arabinose transferase-like glycosyltransferase